MLNCLLMVTVAALMSLKAAANPASLASVELPPYASKDMPGQGVTASIVRAALASQNVEVNISFYPWLRAIAMTTNSNGNTIGFFPAYTCNQDPSLIQSEPLGISVTGFAQRTDKPISWSTLADLKQYRIGVVSGYHNDEAFDQMIENKQIDYELVNYDKNNVRKLLAGRVDAIVIDRFLLEYLFSFDEDFVGRRAEVQFNSRPLNQRQLYVCLNDTKAGRALAKSLKAGLESIDIGAIVERYIR